MNQKTVYGVSLGGGRLDVISVLVDVRPGLPRFIIGGMGSRLIQEGRERIRSAARCAKLPWPKGRITVSLRPVDLPKHGALLDLAVLAAVWDLKNPEVAYIGSVALDGSVTVSSGIAGALIAAHEANLRVVVPLEAQEHAERVVGLEYCCVSNIAELHRPLRFTRAMAHQGLLRKLSFPLFNSLHGQIEAKRALLIALAGKHSILFWGPVGSGKTHLAKAAAELTPLLTNSEWVVVQKFMAKHDLPSVTTDERSFIVVPSSASVHQIFGASGYWKQATQGILFLDELPEYQRITREALRQPLEGMLEEKQENPVVVIAAANTCRCGNLGSNESCRCSAIELVRYRNALSPALLDRFALHIHVPWQPSEVWAKPEDKGSEYAEKIESTWRDKATRQEISLATKAASLLDKAQNSLRISGRSRKHLTDISKTIALINGRQQVGEEEVAEALQYRVREF